MGKNMVVKSTVELGHVNKPMNTWEPSIGYPSLPLQISTSYSFLLLSEKNQQFYLGAFLHTTTQKIFIQNSPISALFPLRSTPAMIS